jgi:hypothetical protein
MPIEPMFELVSMMRQLMRKISKEQSKNTIIPKQRISPIIKCSKVVMSSHFVKGISMLKDIFLRIF